MARGKGFHPPLCGAQSSISRSPGIVGIFRDKGQFDINPRVIHSTQTPPFASTPGFRILVASVRTPFSGPIPHGNFSSSPQTMDSDRRGRQNSLTKKDNSSFSLTSHRILDVWWLEVKSLSYCSWMKRLMVLPRKCQDISSASRQVQTLLAKSAFSPLPPPEWAWQTDQGGENAVVRANMGSWGLGGTDPERQPHAGIFISEEAASIWHNWMRETKW